MFIDAFTDGRFAVRVTNSEKRSNEARSVKESTDTLVASRHLNIFKDSIFSWLTRENISD